MRKGKLFPVNPCPQRDYWAKQNDVNVSNLRARFTGEIRPPKQGEWFIGGDLGSDIKRAYVSTGNHIMEFPIAILVEVKKVEKVVKVLHLDQCEKH